MSGTSFRPLDVVSPQVAARPRGNDRKKVSRLKRNSIFEIVSKLEIAGLVALIGLAVLVITSG